MTNHLAVRRVTFAFLLLATFGLLAPASSTRLANGQEESPDKLAEAIQFARDRVYPALVNISVVDRMFSQGREERVLAAGSGVIVSPAGHVLTNYHVAGEATRITCRLPSGERVDADRICPDPLTDLCVLKLRMGERRDPTKPLPFASIGASDKLQVGDHVMAIGNPQGLSSSITLGIVSNTSRVFTSFAGDRLEEFSFRGGQSTGILNQWIQHDALILGGNSGGPLVNMQGEVIGINTRGGGGVGFAIPSSICSKVLNQALTFGEVRRGWLGLAVQPISLLERDEGALVASALDVGPAHKAGIRPGDVLMSINDVPINVSNWAAVPRFYADIADLKVGSKVKLSVERDGESHTFTAKVLPLSKYTGKEKVYRRWSVVATTITEPMARDRNYPNTKGILITSVRPGSPCDNAKPPIGSGDVILKVADIEIVGADEFAEAIKKHKRNKKLPVVFRRGKRHMVTVLDMTKKARRRGSAELQKAWLGVSTQVVTRKVAEAIGAKGTKGFRITRVLPRTEAEKAGLKVGDVITTLDGDKLKASTMQDQQLLRRKIEDKDIGAESTLGVLRDGKTIEVKVTLEESPEPPADARTAEDTVLEYKVRELTYTDLVGRDLDLDTKGVIVANVTSGGWAHVAGLSGGDIPLEIQGKPIESLKAFKAIVKELGESKPRLVTIFVRRGRSTTFVITRPEWPTD